MDRAQVQSRGGVTLIGAGDPRREDLEEALKLAPTLVAADGGAGFALGWGHRPERVIGDLDSLDPDARRSFPEDRILHVAEQESTDFEKCLTRIDAPFVLAAGFTGGRSDHALAAFSVLARRVGPPTALIDASDVVLAAPGTCTLDLAPGTRVSLFPMVPVSGRSEGLRWPIDGLNLDPMGRIGTSNEATGRVSLAFERPGMLVILPRSALPSVLETLIG